MKYSQLVKTKASNLRIKGYSLGEIRIKLGIAKSTASLWLRNVKLSNQALIRINKNKIKAREKTKITKRKNHERLLANYLAWGKNNYKKVKITPTLARVLCSLLYWAEGAKFTDNRLEFTNSDPIMISAFLKLLRLGFNIDNKKLRANIHLHEYHNEKTQKEFWLTITKIPITQFRKSYYKPHTHKRIRKNYQGCVRICYYSADIARKIKAIYQNLNNYI